MDETSGRARGGRARAEALSPKARKDIAKKAAAARWDEETPTATHIGELEIGDLKLLPAAGRVTQLSLDFGDEPDTGKGRRPGHKTRH